MNIILFSYIQTIIDLSYVFINYDSDKCAQFPGSSPKIQSYDYSFKDGSNSLYRVQSYICFHFFYLRFWHSTTAYAIAKDAGAGVEEYLPPIDSALYGWPSDLLKPSAVVFLTTKESERDERLDTRDERTVEENELRDSRLFRKR